MVNIPVPWILWGKRTLNKSMWPIKKCLSQQKNVKIECIPQTIFCFKCLHCKKKGVDLRQMISPQPKATKDKFCQVHRWNRTSLTSTTSRNWELLCVTSKNFKQFVSRQWDDKKPQMLYWNQSLPQLLGLHFLGGSSNLSLSQARKKIRPLLGGGDNGDL